MSNGNRIKLPIQPKLGECKSNHEMIKVGFQYLFGVNEIIINELNEGREQDEQIKSIIESHESRIREAEDSLTKITTTAKLISKVGAITVGSGGLIMLIIMLLREAGVL